MSSLSLLEQYEDNWETAMGGCILGERVVFRGKDLFDDLGDTSWVELLYFGISGKPLKNEKLKFLNAAYVLCSSFPDPRVWNNRVVSLAGTARSTACLAVAAATAVSEATIYGRRPDIRACDFVTRGNSNYKKGKSIESIVNHELKKYRGIPGFGRPLTSGDERIGPLLDKARSLGLDKGEHLLFINKVQAYLKENRKRLSMNVAGLVAAIMADIGVTPKEHYLICILAFSAGFFPCFVDAEKKEEGAFFPLRVSRINFEGIDRTRAWGE